MHKTVVRDVTASVSTFITLDPEEIGADADLQKELGMASLDLVLLREAIERKFSVTIGDDELASFRTVTAIADLIEAKLQDGAPSEQPVVTAPAATSPHLTGGSHLERDLLFSDLEIGMPMTGRNNLAETPLLREIGHLRWQHISALSGVPSKDVVDDDGDRLYPTFFFVELAFPPAKPMATHRENDRFTVVSSLRRYGRSMLDGEHYLFPSDAADDQKRPPISPEDGLKAGIPFVRLSNSFVKQWQGAGWLKKSRPAAPGFDRVPESAEPPDTHAESNRAKEAGFLFDVPDGYVPLMEQPVDVEYEIVPDRDLNGAGLLYFANYPMILEIAERKVLSGLGMEDELIDLRTLVHRKAAYFSNATQDERLKVSITAFISDPAHTGEDPEIAPIRLLLNYQMERGSDERLMLVSSAKKVVMGRTMADTTLLDSVVDVSAHG